MGGLREEDLSTLDQGLRNLLVHLGLLPGESPALSPQPLCITTDASDTNLQIHHPAPHDGLFECRVELGTRVTAKQELGVVWPLHESDPTPILAEHAGTVILRRHQRSVQRDDPLFTLAEL
jgi:predicted deacylase